MPNYYDRTLEIEKILFKLQIMWKTYPDLTFSKLISNLIGTDVFVNDKTFLDIIESAGDMSLCHFCQKAYCGCDPSLNFKTSRFSE